jgi:hypothetical protein
VLERSWRPLEGRVSGAVLDSIVAVALATGAVAAIDFVAPATGLGVIYLLAVLFVAIRRTVLQKRPCRVIIDSTRAQPLLRRSPDGHP